MNRLVKIRLFLLDYAIKVKGIQLFSTQYLCNLLVSVLNLKGLGPCV